MNPEKFYIKPEEVDGFVSLYEILRHAKTRYPDRIAYRQIESKAEESQISFSEFAKNIEALRASLIARGFSGKHIAVIGETSVEWIATYISIVSGVGVCVPIDKELAPDTIAKQLNYAEAEVVFCSAGSLKKLQNALPDCTSVGTIVIMRGKGTSTVEGFDNVIPFETLIEEGREQIKVKGVPPASLIKPDETCVIIYTSGTTGANKGVMLSNRNIMGTLRGCARLLHFPSVSFSVLPVNHSYELHAHLMSCIYCGTTVCINDDFKHIVKNLERFAPEMSCMVPIMLDLIVRKLKKRIADSGKEKQFYKLIAFSNALRKIGIDRRRLFFRQVLDPLGGKLRMIICGGAPLSQDTVDFLSNIGIQIYNGYGITECSPVAAVNPSAKVRRNSVGHVLPTMKVRIADPDESGNGEIQLHGVNVMRGYFKAPNDTSEVFTEDGWFRTGDIGHLDKDNFLYISGRLKNLIILPNGKNIFPEEVEESLMKNIPYIKECVVSANSENTGIYAICYLDSDFREEHNLTTPEEAKAYMQNDFNNFNSLMPGYKRLTDFEITDKEFEKNTTHKIQRFKIAAGNK